MKATALVLAVALGTAVPAGAQPQTRRAYSAPLGWAGVWTAFAGGLLMVPWREPGATDVRVYGQDQCVINNPNAIPPHYEIARGACRETTPLIKAGLITMGVGGAAALVGFHKVTVQPVLGPSVAGVSASLRW